ncbi:MAG: aminoacetone oxidase family FAD-binding enzyme [Phycisphaerae bacterium]|nr:aminoacetone oxidase family FAD-binding enzyme [Phycisphaerae bacterium]
MGAGAAGLATAIFAARKLRKRTVVALDGARTLGSKILVSGGGRCNVTNRVVTPADFNGGSRNTTKRVLAAFTTEQTIAFFSEIGVELVEEGGGKLFPTSNTATTVRDALIREVERRGVHILTGRRVSGIERSGEAFLIDTGSGDPLRAACVVLATGGRSLPKTGSDGGGYTLAERLEHSLVPTTPGLVPLVLDGAFHKGLSGIAHDAEVTLAAQGSKPVRTRGPILWTHFGVSGPAVLDISRHWHRARLEHRRATLSASFLPGNDFALAEKHLLDLAASRPKLRLHNAISTFVPDRVAKTIIQELNIHSTTSMIGLRREDRRRLIQALLAWPLPVLDSRGYQHAEITAGGVPLSEVDPSSMASRRCPGLYLVGEILDVDGRIGGFNFQWAWSSAWVAAAGIGKQFGP